MRVCSSPSLCVGTFYFPFSHDAIYLPARPIRIPGSLLAQVTYPHIPEEPLSTVCMGRVQQALSQCGLDSLWDAQSLMNPFNGEALSTGEQQRLAFSRVFYHSPPLVILDEATNSLDLTASTSLIDTCARLRIRIWMITHDPSLQALAYFQRTLRLFSDRTYQFT